MEIKEYQLRAMTTCTPSSHNFSYMALGLVEEVGEFMGKVAKSIRKDGVEITRNLLLRKGFGDEMDKQDEELKKELGDIMWMTSGLCSVLGWDLEEIAEMNLAKLAARKAAGTIVGNGDGIDGKDRTK